MLKCKQIVLLCSEANSYHLLSYYLVKKKKKKQGTNFVNFQYKKLISRPALIINNARMIHDRDK